MSQYVRHPDEGRDPGITAIASFCVVVAFWIAAFAGMATEGGYG